jgi:hypothetical protein
MQTSDKLSQAQKEAAQFGMVALRIWMYAYENARGFHSVEDSIRIANDSLHEEDWRFHQEAWMKRGMTLDDVG